MPEKFDIMLITPTPLERHCIEAIFREYALEIVSLLSIQSWQWADEQVLSPSALTHALDCVEAGRILLLDLRPVNSEIEGLYGLSIEKLGADFIYTFYLDIDLCPLPAGIPHTEAAWIAHCLPHIQAVLAQYIPNYRAVALGAELCLDYAGDLDAALQQPHSNVTHWIINKERGVI